MINLKDATELVRKHLGIGSGDESTEVLILEDQTIEFEYGWVFFYQSKEYVLTGNILFALGGNAPIIVNRYDSTLRLTGTAFPIEKYIVDYIKEVEKRL